MCVRAYIPFVQFEFGVEIEKKNDIFLHLFIGALQWVWLKKYTKRSQSRAHNQKEHVTKNLARKFIVDVSTA